MATINSHANGNAKLLCVFCYKPVVKVDPPIVFSFLDTGNELAHTIASDYDPAKTLAICSAFFRQIQLPVSYYSAKRSERKNNDVPGLAGLNAIVPVWNPEKMGICNSCFLAIEHHVTLFEKYEKAQRKVKWQLDRFYQVMKGASKVRDRVTTFEQHVKDDKEKSSMLEFRQTVYKTCHRKLKRITANQNNPIDDFKSTVGNQSQSQSQSESVLSPPNSNSEPGEATLAAGQQSLSRNIQPDISVKKVPKSAQRPGPSKVVSIIRTRAQARKDVGKRTPAAKTTALPPTFKCSKCSYVFLTLSDLTKHTRDKHLVLKEEPCSSKDIDESSMALECNIEIVKGSNEEQMELDELLQNAVEPDRNFDEDCGNSSESDPEVRKNYESLQKIVKNLRPHNFPEEVEGGLQVACSSKNISGGKRKKVDNHDAMAKVAKRQKDIAESQKADKCQEVEKSKIKISLMRSNVPVDQLSNNSSSVSESTCVEEERAIVTNTKKEGEPKSERKPMKAMKMKYNNRSKIRRNYSVKCKSKKCGMTFTAKSMETAERLMFRHLIHTNLHGGNVTWEHDCGYCGKLFFTPKKLNNHIMAKHRDDPRRKKFACRHCQQRFFKRGNLMKHFAERHPEHITTLPSRKKTADWVNSVVMMTYNITPKVEAIAVEH